MEGQRSYVNIWRIALRHIRGNAAKSITIFLCVFGVSALFTAMTLVIGGAENSLNSGLKRLGADILVLPQGTDASVESAFLLGKPARFNLIPQSFRINSPGILITHWPSQSWHHIIGGGN